MRRRGIALKRKEDGRQSDAEPFPFCRCIPQSLSEKLPSPREMRGVPAGSASVHKPRERERGREREREKFPEQQEQNRAVFLLFSEAWRAELPLGVEARAWRRHAESRSAMRMQAVPG